MSRSTKYPRGLEAQAHFVRITIEWEVHQVCIILNIVCQNTLHRHVKVLERVRHLDDFFPHESKKCTKYKKCNYIREATSRESPSVKPSRNQSEQQCRIRSNRRRISQSHLDNSVVCAHLACYSPNAFNLLSLISKCVSDVTLISATGPSPERVCALTNQKLRGLPTMRHVHTASRNPSMNAHTEFIFYIKIPFSKILQIKLDFDCFALYLFWILNLHFPKKFSYSPYLRSRRRTY